MRNLFRTTVCLGLMIFTFSIYAGGNICVQMVKWNENQDSSNDKVQSQQINKNSNRVVHYYKGGLLTNVKYSVGVGDTMKVFPLCGGTTKNMNASRSYTVTESTTDTNAGKIALGSSIEVKIKPNGCESGKVRYQVTNNSC